MKNMSIATKQQRDGVERRSPKQNTDQEHSPSNSNNKAGQEQRLQQQQWNRGKSIATTPRNSKQTPTADTHVTKKSKSLTKQTPVVASTEDTGEGFGEIEHQQPEALSKDENSKWAETLDAYAGIYETPPDYRIYQEGKLQDFFKEASSSGGGLRPKTISDVCLVNDHYILVKMPTEKPETIKREVTFCQSVDDATQRSNRKLCRYLGSKGSRIRKIAPISEEPEYANAGGIPDEPHKSESSKARHCLSVNACWQAHDEEVEVYQTQSRIHKTPNQAIVAVREAATRANKSSQTKAKEDLNSVPRNHKVQEVQTVSSTLFASSLQDTVKLHNYGYLVATNSNNLDISHCHKSCTPQRRKCLRFERFHWLLRPFHGKYRKPKPKIQAVVYKTYFVKWTKPPETHHHGFGSVKLTDLGASVLRRCRSAIF